MPRQESKKFSLKEAFKIDRTSLKILVVITLLNLVEYFWRVKPGMRFIPENYLFRPFTPLLRDLLPYGWTNAHPTLYFLIVAIPTLLYWCFLSILLKFAYRLIKMNVTFCSLIIILITNVNVEARPGCII